jgi:type II secretory pathway pseudopilin PulG
MASGERLRSQRGFTFLAALIAVTLVAGSLVGFSETWSHAQQREKEIQLLWVGTQIRNAIGLYYQRTPGSVKKYPEKLEDLLEDKRYLSMQRYLRRLYADPLTGKAEWGLVGAPGGGIAGVYSLAEGKPVKTAGFGRGEEGFSGAGSYAGWRFLYEAPVVIKPAAEQAVPGGRQK